MAGSYGVHPPYNKELTSKKKIETAPIPDTLYVLLQQHIGAPCDPMVEIGDEVSAYQMIADSKAFVSAPIHSPVDGKITDIAKMPTPVGSKATAIVIEKSKDPKPLSDKREHKSRNKDELIKIIRDAGVVGLGGAAFPTHIKLNPPKEKPIDTLIINAAECEPYLTCDHRLMIEYPKDISEGIKILEQILEPKRILVGVEDNKPDAIAKLKEYLGHDVIPIKTLYPQGAEKTLIETLTGRIVPSGGLPMDVGCVVQNVATVKAIYDAVVFGQPLVDRVVTITGDAVKEPRNLLVKVGTLFSDLIETCGGVDNPQVLINGGPMMGITQFTNHVPTIKGTSGILALKETPSRNQDSCIRCGKCIQACPMNLMPNTLYRHIDQVRVEDALANGLMDCVECGSCSYVCPSNISHVHYMKLGKLKARSIKAKKEAKNE